ncbi:MAG: Dabb family protein [Acidimicrobiales bacterium]|nr:Dabb family protein [Acidimicrobiales bacterium]
MIHHIVLFKLKDASPDNVEMLRQRYYDSLSKVESIDDLKVEVSTRKTATSYDIVQDSTFKTVGDLDLYLKDPRHHEAGRMLVQASESVASCDYET